MAYVYGHWRCVQVADKSMRKLIGACMRGASGGAGSKQDGECSLVLSSVLSSVAGETCPTLWPSIRKYATCMHVTLMPCDSSERVALCPLPFPFLYIHTQRRLGESWPRAATERARGCCSSCAASAGAFCR